MAKVVVVVLQFHILCQYILIAYCVSSEYISVLLTFWFQHTTCLKTQLELVCNTDLGQSSHLHLYCLSCGFHTHMQLLIKMVPIPLEYQIFILL